MMFNRCTLLASIIFSCCATAQPTLLQTEGYALLVPVHEAKLSGEITARIEKMPIRDGDTFKKGQLLVQFHCQKQKAELNKAKAEVKSTAIAWDSAKQLESLESGSKVEVATAEANHKKALAEEKRLSSIVSHCTINAPYDGKVKKRYVHTHEVVKPGEPLMEILDHKHFEIKLFVPSTWLSWLKVGTPFSIHFNELDRSYKAKVIKLGAHVDAASQTIKVYGQLDKPDKNLISGISGIAKFLQGVK